MKEAKTKQKKKGDKRRSAFRFLRWGDLLPAVAAAGIGVLLLSLPENSLHVLSIASGVAFYALAVLFLAFAFGGTRAGFVQLAIGAACIAFAVWLFVQPGEAVSALLIVLTALLLLRGLLGVFYSLSAKKRGGNVWQFVLVFSLVLSVCAFVLFFIPIVSFDLQLLLLGILCCADGGMELFGLFHRLTGKLSKGQKKEEEPQKEEEKPKEKKPKKEKQEEEPKPETEETEEVTEVPKEKKERKWFKRS